MDRGATCYPLFFSPCGNTSHLYPTRLQWIESAIGHVESAVMRLKADMEHAVARALSVFDGLGTRPAVAVAAPEAEATLEREAPPEPPSSVPVHARSWTHLQFSTCILAVFPARLRSCAFWTFMSEAFSCVVTETRRSWRSTLSICQPSLHTLDSCCLQLAWQMPLDLVA